MGEDTRTGAFQAALDCLGVSVAHVTWESLRDWFFTAARARGEGPAALYFANVHTLNLAWSDASFRAVLGRADAVLNDGVGVELYSRFAGARFAENFNGTDLVPRLLAHADVTDPLRLFLYGAVRGRADRAARTLEERFPAVRVVGTADGYTREGVIEAINAASPDVVLVGMGNPLQERWIDEHKRRLDAGVVAGVGALIDFLSGEVERAPAWVRSVRCEWLYRLAREPRRMFARYVLGNPAFLVRTALYLGLGVKPRAIPAPGPVPVPASALRPRRV